MSHPSSVSQTMRAVVNTGPGRVEMRTLPLPEPGPGQVRIRAAACGVCATDLEMIAGWDRTGFPAVPGHEWSGRVDTVGLGVDASLRGRACVAENVLADGGEVGFEHAGGYGEFLITEATNVRVLPEDFPLDVATMIEPLAVCVRAMRRIRLEDRSAAAVLGDGPVGLILVMLLKHEGVGRVALVGGRPGRLDLARKLGVDVVVNYHAVEDLAGGVLDATGGAVPNVFEASGSAAAMDASIRIAAREGKVLVVGDYGSARADLPWNSLLHRELELIGSNASAGAWDEAVRLAVDAKLPLAELITHRFPPEHYTQAIDVTRDRDRGCVKAVMVWTR